jgi:hypothetical protein
VERGLRQRPGRCRVPDRILIARRRRSRESTPHLPLRAQVAAVGDVRRTIRSSKSALSESPLGPSASMGIVWAIGSTHAQSPRMTAMSSLARIARSIHRSSGMEKGSSGGAESSRNATTRTSTAPPPRGRGHEPSRERRSSHAPSDSVGIDVTAERPASCGHDGATRTSDKLLVSRRGPGWPKGDIL